MTLLNPLLKAIILLLNCTTYEEITRRRLHLQHCPTFPVMSPAAGTVPLRHDCADRSHGKAIDQITAADGWSWCTRPAGPAAQSAPTRRVAHSHPPPLLTPPFTVPQAAPHRCRRRYCSHDDQRHRGGVLNSGVSALPHRQGHPGAARPAVRGRGPGALPSPPALAERGHWQDERAADLLQQPPYRRK